MLRSFPKNLKKHWDEPMGLIQIYMGPRQVGKTTTATTLMTEKNTIFANADTENFSVYETELKLF